ncbi:AraC family transcriptional regulator [Nocardioides anomalus]|uniref:AraC family transcriptional regulator n=1 Tax=Nocardioides anomalus TaxID=2712223 RepID=A0A6G6WCU1_9ACTN|nr:AraC family transcriptional regulator [Nocardioides anomalus]QIG42860.1 AraC family transcriptional regulator [Nocardioides anomalus]
MPGTSATSERVRAWRPAVPGLAEVLHAHFDAHAYPAHVHESWTVLLVDAGGVDYTLDGRAQQAVAQRVTVLPPYVSHDGRSASPGGFDKRVLYVDERWLPASLTGAALRHPSFDDPGLARAVSAVHASLADPLEAESRLALVTERIAGHLSAAGPSPDRDPGLARLVRARLDTDHPPTLDALARELGTHPSHLVRVFRREHGLPPHRYVVGRRLDRARRLLLDGVPAAEVAVAVGFHDQSHLTRHFRALLGTTPGRFRMAA